MLCQPCSRDPAMLVLHSRNSSGWATWMSVHTCTLWHPAGSQCMACTSNLQRHEAVKAVSSQASIAKGARVRAAEFARGVEVQPGMSDSACLTGSAPCNAGALSAPCCSRRFVAPHQSPPALGTQRCSAPSSPPLLNDRTGQPRHVALNVTAHAQLWNISPKSMSYGLPYYGLPY